MPGPACATIPTMLAASLLLLAGCTAGGTVRPAAQLTDRQRAELTKAIGDKTRREPVSCVSRIIGTNGLRALSDEVLLYRVNRDLVYVNDLTGSCSGISRGSTLVLRPLNDQYCRGDFAWSLDLFTGMRGTACVLGNFIPYRTAGK